MSRSKSCRPRRTIRREASRRPSSIDTVSRVGSFFALGLLLVATSYLYQRRRRDDTSGGDSEPPAGDPGTLRDG